MKKILSLCAFLLITIITTQTAHAQTAWDEAIDSDSDSDYVDSYDIDPSNTDSLSDDIASIGMKQDTEIEGNLGGVKDPVDLSDDPSDPPHKKQKAP